MNSDARIMGEKTMAIKSKRVMYIIIKRIFDIICSLLGCILLIPVSILVKLLYIITGDFNSIFLVQKRISINGKE